MQESEKQLYKSEKASGAESAGMEILTIARGLVSNYEKTGSLTGDGHKMEFQRFQKTIADSKEKCLKDFLDRAEEISAVFDLPDFLNNQAFLKEAKFASAEERGKFIQGLTEYFYLLTDFVEKNGGDRKYLEEFWSYFGKAAYGMGMKAPQLEALRSGILGQVAMKSLLDQAGIPARLSTPREDAFYKIDFFVEDYWGKIGAIQSKTSQEFEDFEIIEDQDKIALPNFILFDDEEDKVFFTNLIRQMQGFRAKTYAYAQAIGKPTKAYMFLLPRDEIDGINGRPSDRLRRDFYDKFGSTFGKRIESGLKKSAVKRINPKGCYYDFPKKREKYARKRKTI